jgi:hypothetical protein
MTSAISSALGIQGYVDFHALSFAACWMREGEWICRRAADPDALSERALQLNNYTMHA